MTKQFLDKLYGFRSQAMDSFNEAVREMKNEQPTTSFESWKIIKEERYENLDRIDKIIEAYLETL